MSGRSRKSCFPRAYWAWLSPTGEILTSTIREREGDSNSCLRKIINYKDYREEDCIKTRVSIDVIKQGDSNMNQEEPKPIKNSKPAVWDLVMADMKERDQIGLSKYGTRLQPFNGRDNLKDAYQEALDLVVYLRNAIYERDNE